MRELRAQHPPERSSCQPVTRGVTVTAAATPKVRGLLHRSKPVLGRLVQPSRFVCIVREPAHRTERIFQGMSAPVGELFESHIIS